MLAAYTRVVRILGHSVGGIVILFAALGVKSARRVQLRGLDHVDPSSEGNPERLAAELRCFSTDTALGRRGV